MASQYPLHVSASFSGTSTSSSSSSTFSSSSSSSSSLALGPWRLESFSTLGSHDKWAGSEFLVGGFSWRMRVYPRSPRAQSYLAVFIYTTDGSLLSASQHNVSFRLTLHNQRSSARSLHFETSKHTWVRSNFLNETSTALGFDRVLLLRTLMDPSEGFLVGDTLLISARVAVSVAGSSTATRVSCDPPSTLMTSPRSSPPASFLLQDVHSAKHPNSSSSNPFCTHPTLGPPSSSNSEWLRSSSSSSSPSAAAPSATSAPAAATTAAASAVVAPAAAAAAVTALGTASVESSVTRFFRWQIRPFSAIARSTKAFRCHLPTTEGGCKWSVLLYPGGNGVPNHLALYLEASSATGPVGESGKGVTLDSDKSVSVCISFAVIDPKDMHSSLRKTTVHRFTSKASVWGFADFVGVPTLQSTFVHEDSLIIDVELNVIIATTAAANSSSACAAPGGPSSSSGGGGGGRVAVSPPSFVLMLQQQLLEAGGAEFGGGGRGTGGGGGEQGQQGANRGLGRGGGGGGSGRRSSGEEEERHAYSDDAATDLGLQMALQESIRTALQEGSSVSAEDLRNAGLTDDDLMLFASAASSSGGRSRGNAADAASKAAAAAAQQQQEQQEARQCVVCLDAAPNAVCVPCGHIAACLECLRAATEKKAQCPVCSQRVREVIKVFWST